MSKAAEFIQAWKNQTKTISIKDLLPRVDHKARLESRKEYPRGYTIEFSDGSAVRTEGRGQRFKIWNMGA